MGVLCCTETDRCVQSCPVHHRELPAIHGSGYQPGVTEVCTSSSSAARLKIMSAQASAVGDRQVSQLGTLVAAARRCSAAHHA